MDLSLFGKIEARLPPDVMIGSPDRLRVGFLGLGADADVYRVADLLEEAALDVVLLAEVDVGMSRSGNLHDAAVLADSLDMGYAFAVDALALPDEAAAAGHLGGDADLYGLVGTAALFRPVLHRLGGLRVDMSGRWFMRGTERRVGGTLALFAQCALGTEAVIVVTLALDPEVPLSERQGQLLGVLEQLDTYDPLSAALIAVDPGGDDLFTNLDGFTERPRLSRLVRSFVRLDPLLEAFLKRGFSWASGRLGAGVTSECRGVFFARKLAPEGARLVPALKPSGGRLARSDLIAVDIKLV